MKTLEDYKRALINQPNPYVRERLIAEADKDGFDAWALDELARTGAEAWA